MTAVLLFATWPFLSRADIPVKHFDCRVTLDAVLLAQSDTLTYSDCTVNTNASLEMTVSFAIYWVNLIAFFDFSQKLIQIVFDRLIIHPGADGGESPVGAVGV